MGVLFLLCSDGGEPYRVLLQPLQQFLLDGVVQLSGDQGFLLPEQRGLMSARSETREQKQQEETAGNSHVTSLLFSRLSIFLLKGMIFLLRGTRTIRESFSLLCSR